MASRIASAISGARRLPLQVVRRKGTAVAESEAAYGYAPKPGTFIPENAAMRQWRLEMAHHDSMIWKWRWGSLLFFVPAIGASMYYTISEEIKHVAHWKEHPVEFVNYEYMRLDEPFGWSSYKSYFHNPYINPLPPSKDF